METFWVVWNENHREPMVKHHSDHSAASEAARLARLYPGEQFHVLESISTCEVQDLKVTKHKMPLPF